MVRHPHFNMTLLFRPRIIWKLASAAFLFVAATVVSHRGFSATNAAPSQPGALTAPPTNIVKMEAFDVTVTVQKRPQSVQEVPISMTSLSGREIENYIRTDTMMAALSGVHPGTQFARPRDEWTHVYRTKAGAKMVPDKIRIAKAASVSIDLDVLDLRARVEELVQFVRRCNE